LEKFRSSLYTQEKNKNRLNFDLFSKKTFLIGVFIRHPNPLAANAGFILANFKADFNDFVEF